MDIRSLRYFIETVRLSSFTQAAETLHVTQSTISKMVHQLEQEVGSPLLVRDGRKLTLTDTGQIVFARGEEMLTTMRQLKREIRDMQALQQGSLRIGIPPMINVLFTPVLKAFRERYPKLTLVLHEDTGQIIEQQVASGEIEIGLTLLPVNPDLSLSILPVARYPVWALAQTGTFRKEPATLRFNALRDLPLVLLKDNFAFTRRLRKVFQEAGFEPVIAAQSGQWDWLVAMATAGIGVALLPEPFIDRMATDRLEAVRLIEPEVSWQVAHVWDGRYLSHAARAWLAVCAEVLGPADLSVSAGLSPHGSADIATDITIGIGTDNATETGGTR
jgi:DNA-binding transcriptional LysR family regulator